MNELVDWYDGIYKRLTHDEQQAFWKVFDQILEEEKKTVEVIKNEG